MKYVFSCYGHKNIRATHCKTIEFTKDPDLTVKGDCIIGVRADFDKKELKKLSRDILITVEVSALKDTFRAVINPNFDDDHEIVFRKSLYKSERTLGVRLNKGSNRLDREIVGLLQDPETVMKVTLEEVKESKSRRDHSEIHPDHSE